MTTDDTAAADTHLDSCKGTKHPRYRKYCIQLLLIFSLKNISATFILLLLKRTFVNLLGNSESEITEKGDEKSGGMDNVLDILINCLFYFLILSWQRVI